MSAPQESVEITIGDKVFSFPVISGTYEEKAIDISTLRAQTGYITLDSGYKNTGGTTSSITFIDGEVGILEHRGYAIQDLTENASFTEVMYLLLYGELPDSDQHEAFLASIAAHTGLPVGVKSVLNSLPQETHPMGMLTAALGALTGFFPEDLESWQDETTRNRVIMRVLANMPVLTAYIYRRSQGLAFIEPNTALSYSENFMTMMFGTVVPEAVEAMDKLLILHADHEQNCSTSTVRLAGSSQTNLYSAVAAGVSALWGPLHGGANMAVLEMLDNIMHDGGDADKYLAKAKDKNDPFRLMGFGHRVYKNYDPRASTIKQYTDKVLDALGVDDPSLDLAKKLESQALLDSYFVDRKLFPNVDFYSGIIYKAMGIPVEMFTVLFALGRTPGWVSQWKEMREGNEPIGRPRQIYTGYTARKTAE